MLKKMKKYYNI